jgi:Ca-activated chloride channel homolog
MMFGSPAWLFLLAALPLLAVLFLRAETRGKKLLTRVVAERLRKGLTASLSVRRRRVRLVLMLAGIACLIVAMAKPQRGYVWDQAQRRGRDVLAAIDTSRSMNANDLAPDRLTRAKFAAQDLMEQLPGDRLGLIAFAGTAFLQAPLTIDYSAVLNSLNELDTNVIPQGGTNISAAIDAAREAFGKGESEHRALIIFTDGEDLAEDAVKKARAVAGSIRIFTVGVGTAEGSLVPVRDENGGTSFVKDPQGNFVKSRLDETRLREIAEATGGFYIRLANGPADMKAIIERGLGAMKERDIDARESRRPIERYQWPLALGLLLIAASVLLNERRRVTARRVSTTVAALLAALVFTPQPACAVNEGVKLYEKQKYAESLATFEKQLARKPGSAELQFDIGASAYKAGDYDKALKAFGSALTSPDTALREKAQYNLGNTLFQRGAKQEAKESKQREWVNALQHFDEVLKANPANENAKFNRDAVQRALDELKKQEQQKQDQQNKQDDKQQKQDQQKNQQQSQQDKQNQQKQNEQAQKDTEQALQKQQQANQEQDSQKKEQRQQEASDAAKQAQQSVDKAAENQKQQQQQDQQKQEKSAAEKASDEMKQARDEQQKTDPQQGKAQEERDKAGQQAEEHLKNALDQMKEQQKQDERQQQGGKGEQKQDEKSGKQQDEQKSEQQKADENKGQPQNGQSNQQGQPSPTPQPAEPQEQRKPSGDIKAQNEPKPDEKSQEAQAAQAAEAVEKSGEMSERQAVMLLNSMKDEDANVSLREQKGSVPVLRDW